MDSIHLAWQQLRDGGLLQARFGSGAQLQMTNGRSGTLQGEIDDLTISSTRVRVTLRWAARKRPQDQTWRPCNECELLFYFHPNPRSGLDEVQSLPQWVRRNRLFFQTVNGLVTLLPSYDTDRITPPKPGGKP